VETAAMTRLMADLNVYRIKEKLLQYPQKIKDKKDEVRQFYKYVQEGQMAKKEYEAEVLAKISLETCPDSGKKKYSTDKSRQAAVQKKLKNDFEYHDLVKIVNTAQDKHSRAQDELDQLFDEYKSWQLISEITSNELQLWAGRARSGNLKDLKQQKAMAK